LYEAATVLPPVNQLGHCLTDCWHAPRQSSFPSPPLTEVSPAIDPDSLRRRTKTVIIDPDIFRLLDPIILPSIIRLSISGMKIGRTLPFIKIVGMTVAARQYLTINDLTCF
jgi:hypothetical protein